MATDSAAEGGDGFVGGSYVQWGGSCGNVSDFIMNGRLAFVFEGDLVFLEQTYGGTVFYFVGVANVGGFFATANDGGDDFVRGVFWVDACGA